ncbi:MAG: carbonic anhydrase, partial [Pseudobdellovibrionaceae bacterium]
MNKSIYRLMAGFRKFREKYFLQDDLENSVYYRLANSGQTPKTLLIGCSDSRVDPAILTGAAPGELFVVRNVANLVPPYETGGKFHGTSSAIEFAVINLKVENIIVLGHRQCGGIRALMRGPSSAQDSFVDKWMKIAAEARNKVLIEHASADEETRCRFAEMESIRVSLKNLRTFPFVHEAIEAKQLTLIGVYFDLEEGQLWECDDNSKEFRQLII